MSNYLTAKEELLICIRSRTPFIVIESSERERVERMLCEIASEQQIAIDYYTDSKQLSVLGRGNPSSTEINHDPLQYGYNKFKKGRNGIFAIGDITRVENDNAYSREFLNLLYMAKESASTVLVITADAIWPRLSVLGTKVALDFPSQTEITELIRDFIKMYSGRFTVDWTEKDIVRVATLLKGLSESQLENALSTELIAHNGLFVENINKLVRQKDKLYGSVGAVQLIRLPEKVSVSGMENLKAWLASKKDVFYAPEELLKYYHLKVPKGILLAGVPGCGKSFCAKMIAKEWGLPLYKFDIGTLFDKWMGESERKMRESLSFIDNVSPCILWIDEIEKVLSTSDSSNDTGNRILGQFLFWLQESMSRVFLVATANNIQKLPAELFRKGRFSEIFFADLPSEKERCDVIRLYIEQSLHKDFSDEEILQIAKVTEGYSYADIETAIKEVSQMLIVSQDLLIDIDMIIKQVKSIVPISKSNPELVEQCRAWGRNKAINVSMKEDQTK